MCHQWIIFLSRGTIECMTSFNWPSSLKSIAVYEKLIQLYCSNANKFQLRGIWLAKSMGLVSLKILGHRRRKDNSSNLMQITHWVMWWSCADASASGFTGLLLIWLVWYLLWNTVFFLVSGVQFHLSCCIPNGVLIPSFLMRRNQSHAASVWNDRQNKGRMILHDKYWLSLTGF